MEYSNPYIELCLEASSSVFKGLKTKEKELIDKHHYYAVFKKGDMVIKEGDKARGFICLVSGKLKVFRTGVGGRGTDYQNGKALWIYRLPDTLL